jgi:hypothetical protein
MKYSLPVCDGRQFEIEPAPPAGEQRGQNPHEIKLERLIFPIPRKSGRAYARFSTTRAPFLGRKDNVATNVCCCFRAHPDGGKASKGLDLRCANSLSQIFARAIFHSAKIRGLEDEEEKRKRIPKKAGERHDCARV